MTRRLANASLLFRGARSVWQSAEGRRYGFASLGHNTTIAWGCRIQGARCMTIGDHVKIQRGSWLVVPSCKEGTATNVTLVVDDGCDIGEHCTISAVSHIRIYQHVLLGPRVWITDHNHRYEDIDRPIMDQGWSTGGGVEIGENSWIGTGAVVIGKKPLRIGRGCVVGANAVVTRSVPDYCVVAGNPATIIRRYDSTAQLWRNVPEPLAD